MRKVEPFDKRLKERAKQEPFPLPETYAGKVRDTCAALKETNMKENKQKRSYRWLVGVAAALAVFVAIPNVSPGGCRHGRNPGAGRRGAGHHLPGLPV